MFRKDITMKALRKLLAPIVVLAIAILLTACGGGGDAGTTTPPTGGVLSTGTLSSVTVTAPIAGATSTVGTITLVTNATSPQVQINGITVPASVGFASGSITATFGLGANTVTLLDGARVLDTKTLTVSAPNLGTAPSEVVAGIDGGTVKNASLYLPASNAYYSFGGNTRSCSLYDQKSSDGHIVFNCRDTTAHPLEFRNYAVSWTIPTTPTLVPYAGTPSGTLRSTGYNVGTNPYAACGVLANQNGEHVVLASGALFYSVPSGMAYELRLYNNAATAVANGCTGYSAVASPSGVQYMQRFTF
jgi:hypothetical protein